MTRRERLEAKLERRREWAEKARGRAAARFDAAHSLAARIPMGQPILVGHHSERHARRDAERIEGNLSKGVAETRLADDHQAKAAGLSGQLERAIFSDDSNAVEALEARIATNEATAKRYAEINRAWRKTAGTTEERIASLVATGACSQQLASTIAEIMKLCPWLDKPFDATNVRARIRSDRERIEEIRRRAAKSEAAVSAVGGVLVEDAGPDHVRVTFAKRPERAVLDALRAAGFWWAHGSWAGLRQRLPAEVAAMLKAA